LTATPELSALQDEWSRESRSEQQRRDVSLLLETPLDRAYLDEWALRLGLDGLLKEATGE
jgi:hypothetical protein